MSTSPAPGICRVCGGPAPVFAHARLLGRHDIRYERCSRCGFIQTEEPYWLDEAYSEAIAASDIGLVRRNFILAAVTRSVIRSYCNESGAFVDYGGGYGMLTRLLRDADLDAYRYDPLCRNLFAGGFDAEPPPRPSFELVTAFEVFEHLVDPVAGLGKMLAFSRNILFTTLLQPTPVPLPHSWWYYCTDTGQHVSFHTRESLAELGRRHGLHFVSDGRNLHMFSNAPRHALWFKLITRYRVAGMRCPFIAGSRQIQTDHARARR